MKVLYRVLFRAGVLVLMWAAPLVAAPAAEPTAPPAGFVVNGTLAAQFYGRSNLVVHSQSFQFHVAVQQAWWQIHVGWTNGGSYHYVSDGKTVVEWFEDPEFPQSPRPTIIHEDGFPANDGYIGVLPWLAFASGSYLKEKRPLPHPVIPARHSPGAFMFRARVSLLAFPPYLPESVAFFVDGSQRRAALRNPALKIEGLQERLQYERRKAVRELASRDGQLSAEYYVTQTTNVDALVVPLTAELKAYASGTTNRLASLFRLSVSQASPFHGLIGWPQNTNGWSVGDRRFRSSRQGIDSILYNTNRLIPSMNDERLQLLFRQKKAAAPFLRMDALWEPIIWSAFGLLMIGPIVVLWIWSRKVRLRGQMVNAQKQNQETETNED